MTTRSPSTASRRRRSRLLAALALVLAARGRLSRCGARCNSPPIRPARRIAAAADGGDASAAPVAGARRRARSHLAAARRHRQRRELPQPDAGLRRCPGQVGRRRAQGDRLCPRARAEDFGRRRQAQHGRPRVLARRRGARHDVVQQPVARRRPQDDHRRERRDLARHPEHAASALRGQGDAVHRHLHGRRIDLGQRTRDGPSVRIGWRLDPRDARHARRRQRGAGQPDRERAAVPPRRRRLRPVRRHPRRRSRHRRQRGLPVGAAGHPVPRVPGPARTARSCPIGRTG